MNLEGKVALVTGSAKRLGRNIAQRLAQEGAKVIVHYNQSEEEAKETADAVGSYTVQADLRDPEQAKRIVSEIEERSSRIDFLVNNIGNFSKREFGDIDPDEWRFSIDTTLNLTFYVCQAVLPQMAKRRYGKIVNIIDSQASSNHIPRGWLPYCIGKNGVLMLTRYLAREYGEYGITVNAVSPGIIENSVVKLPIEQFPLSRYATQEDISNCVLFLLREESSYISGANIKVDGAWSC